MENPHAKHVALPSLGCFSGFIGSICHFAQSPHWRFGHWHGVVAGYSGLCGGLIALLPNMYFAHRAFRFPGARAAQAIVRSFYAGEAGN